MEETPWPRIFQFILSDDLQNLQPSLGGSLRAFHLETWGTFGLRSLSRLGNQCSAAPQSQLVHCSYLKNLKNKDLEKHHLIWYLISLIKPQLGSSEPLKKNSLNSSSRNSNKFYSWRPYSEWKKQFFVKAVILYTSSRVRKQLYSKLNESRF